MAKRWRRAFYRVNPYREQAPQMTFREWLRLLPRERENDLVQDRLITKLVDTLSVIDSYAHHKIAIEPQTIALGASEIDSKNRNSMVKLILEEGTRKAKEWCESGHGKFEVLVEFETESSKNQLTDGSWTVHGTWKFRYRTQQAASVTGDWLAPNNGPAADR